MLFVSITEYQQEPIQTLVGQVGVKCQNILSMLSKGNSQHPLWTMQHTDG